MTQTLTTRILNRHGLNIAVQVDIPGNPKGLLVMVHGWTSSRNSTALTAMTKAALANNIIALRFDCTRSSGESDGSVELSSITSFREDLDTVMDWAKTQSWYQAPYIMSGSSLGGITILEYAHRHPEEVKALAPVATVISGTLSIEAHDRKDPADMAEWKAKGEKLRTYSAGTALFPWSHMADRLKYNALAYAPELTMPVFMLGGSEDESCPPDHQQQLFDALGSVDKEHHIVEDAPHSLKLPEHLSILEDRFGSWLSRILGAESSKARV